MLRFVSPAGTSVALREFFSATRTLLRPEAEEQKYLSSFAGIWNVSHAFGLSSGRAAFWLILKTLHRLRPDRDVVAIPAYTCFSVAAAIVRAGLKIHPVEVDPRTLDFDYARLAEVPGAKLLCIVTSNLFGIVNDGARICDIARHKGAFVVDDAAQALGASRNGQFAGTIGDVGFCSMGRGKPLAGKGGLILTNSQTIAEGLGDEILRIPRSSWSHDSRLFLEVLAGSLLLNPRLYWIPRGLPFLKLGVTEFNPYFSIARLPAFSLALLPHTIGRLAELNETRNRNARKLIHGIEGSSSFFVPGGGDKFQASYLRLPVLAKSGELRNRAITKLNRAGIGASPFYPSAICDIPAVAQYLATPDFHRPCAEELSRRLLTLPTHPLVGERDVQRMLEVLGGMEAAEPAPDRSPVLLSRPSKVC